MLLRSGGYFLPINLYIYIVWFGWSFFNATSKSSKNSFYEIKYPQIFWRLFCEYRAVSCFVKLLRSLVTDLYLHWTISSFFHSLFILIHSCFIHACFFIMTCSFYFSLLRSYGDLIILFSPSVYLISSINYFVGSSFHHFILPYAHPSSVPLFIHSYLHLFILSTVFF
jgi:hypothetical protein